MGCFPRSSETALDSTPRTLFLECIQKQHQRKTRQIPKSIAKQVSTIKFAAYNKKLVNLIGQRVRGTEDHRYKDDPPERETLAKPQSTRSSCQHTYREEFDRMSRLTNKETRLSRINNAQPHHQICPPARQAHGLRGCLYGQNPDENESCC